MSTLADLLAAQEQGLALLAEVERRGILAPGVGEREASDQIRDLAAEQFGVSRHWHKRIVRGGPNTLEPYAHNPPDRTLGEDDIAFLDLGPVFDGWEADLGRTYVLGDDPVKHRLVADLSDVFALGTRHFQESKDITGEELYAFMCRQATDRGWEFGGDIAGHVVGAFPHARADAGGPKIHSNVAERSTRPMRRDDDAGQPCTWILEVHLVDRERQIGGFFEQLLLDA